MIPGEVNIPLLRKAVEWAEVEAAKPQELCEWVQGAYIVPRPADRDRFTALGWLHPNTAQRWAEVEWQERGKSSECGTCFCIAGYIAHQVADNFDYCSAAPIALTALCIETAVVGDNYDDLFAPTNSISDVRRIAEEIAGERL